MTKQLQILLVSKVQNGEELVTAVFVEQVAGNYDVKGVVTDFVKVATIGKYIPVFSDRLHEALWIPMNATVLFRERLAAFNFVDGTNPPRSLNTGQIPQVLEVPNAQRKIDVEV